MLAQQLNYRPKLDRIRKPDNPRQWRHALLVVGTPDRTRARSEERFAPGIKDQGPEGSCTGQGGTSSAEFCQAIAGQPVESLCRMELYVDERLDEGQTPGALSDTGAAVADSIDSQTRRGGLGPESAWPYDANPRELQPAGYPPRRLLYVAGHQPIDFSSNDAAINGILAAFDNRTPTVIGFDFYEEFFAQFQQTGVLAAKPASALAGGHEVFSACVYAPPNPAVPETGRLGLVGYDNSWGLTSPARTDIHPDARAGMIWIPLEAHGGGGYVNEGHAVLPNIAPAPLPSPENLTLQLSIPGAGFPAQAVPMIATVGGLLPGHSAIVAWDFGDGTKGAGEHAAHAYVAPGTYVVTCVATDSDGSAASVPATGRVVIAANPPPPSRSAHDLAIAVLNRDIAFCQARAAATSGVVSRTWTWAAVDVLQQWVRAQLDQTLKGL